MEDLHKKYGFVSRNKRVRILRLHLEKVFSYSGPFLPASSSASLSVSWEMFLRQSKIPVCISPLSNPKFPQKLEQVKPYCLGDLGKNKMKKTSNLDKMGKWDYKNQVGFAESWSLFILIIIYITK